MNKWINKKILNTPIVVSDDKAVVAETTIEVFNANKVL